MTQYLVTVRARRDAEPPQQLYLLDGELATAEIQQLTAELLHDSVVQVAAWQPLDQLKPVELPAFAEVAYKPGVTDNEAESILIGARRLGIGPPEVASGDNRRKMEGDHHVPGTTAGEPRAGGGR